MIVTEYTTPTGRLRPGRKGLGTPEPPHSALLGTVSGGLNLRYVTVDSDDLSGRDSGWSWDGWSTFPWGDDRLSGLEFELIQIRRARIRKYPMGPGYVLREPWSVMYWDNTKGGGPVGPSTWVASFEAARDIAVEWVDHGNRPLAWWEKIA